jgi:hypothetical protein
MRALPGYTASELLAEPFEWVVEWELLIEAEAEAMEERLRRE